MNSCVILAGKSILPGTLESFRTSPGQSFLHFWIILCSNPLEKAKSAQISPPKALYFFIPPTLKKPNSCEFHPKALYFSYHLTRKTPNSPEFLPKTLYFFIPPTPKSVIFFPENRLYIYKKKFSHISSAKLSKTKKNLPSPAHLEATRTISQYLSRL